MISSITLYCASLQQRSMDFVSGSEFREKARKTARVAWEILKIVIAVKFNPYCALVALGAGLLFPEETQRRLDRITHLADNNKAYAVPGLIAFSVIFLPIAALGTSLYIGARTGSRIMLMNLPLTAVEDRN